MGKTEVLPWVLGNKETWPISNGEQGNKDKTSSGKKEQKRLGDTGTRQSLREDKKWKKKQNDVAGTYLSLHPICKFCLHPCGQHGCKQNVELGYEYDEFTLGDWMLGKIIKKLVGSGNTVVV